MIIEQFDKLLADALKMKMRNRINILRKLENEFSKYKVLHNTDEIPEQTIVINLIEERNKVLDNIQNNPALTKQCEDEIFELYRFVIS